MIDSKLKQEWAARDAEAGAAMKELLARIPREFGHAEELDLVFQPEHGTKQGKARG